jgi:integration host factor subunit alpha
MKNKNFTRNDLIISIYKNLGFSKNLSSKIIDDFFIAIRNELTRFKKVKISSFGTLEILNKKERVGRNPKNKKLAKITARKVVKFSASKILRDKINKL